MDEFDIIRRFFDRAPDDESIVIGVGDDGAILRPTPGHDLISVVDTIVSGVHFPDTLPPIDIGYRAVAVNVSDIAAMGGEPRWMTMALTLVEAHAGWLEEYSAGVFEAAEKYGVSLVGGDITHGSELVISIQINGEVEPGNILTRSGARAGDGVYVTGTVGDAAAGLSVLQSSAPVDGRTDYLVQRFARPSARVEAGRSIAVNANSAIDLSDGLYTDLEKLLAASGVAASVEIGDLPMSAQLTELMAIDDARQFALAGGDDYEICFTGPPGQFDSLDAVAGTPITRIGSVREGEGITCTLNGDRFDFQDKGYRHFR